MLNYVYVLLYIVQNTKLFCYSFFFFQFQHGLQEQKIVTLTNGCIIPSECAEPPEYNDKMSYTSIALNCALIFAKSVLVIVSDCII